MNCGYEAGIINGIMMPACHFRKTKTAGHGAEIPGRSHVYTNVPNPTKNVANVDYRIDYNCFATMSVNCGYEAGIIEQVVVWQGRGSKTPRVT